VPTTGLDPADDGPSTVKRHRILVEWNETVAPGPPAAWPAFFEAGVRRSPETVALVFGETELTYAEVNARANRLAHGLLARGRAGEGRRALPAPVGGDDHRRGGGAQGRRRVPAAGSRPPGRADPLPARRRPARLPGHHGHARRATAGGPGAAPAAAERPDRGAGPATRRRHRFGDRPPAGRWVRPLLRAALAAPDVPLSALPLSALPLPGASLSAPATPATPGAPAAPVTPDRPSAPAVPGPGRLPGVRRGELDRPAAA